MSESITIPGRCGDAAIVRAGERIKIVNITGEQVAVGTSDNTFTVKAGANTSLDNYEITQVAQ